jgi:hypothetical protein
MGGAEVNGVPMRRGQWSVYEERVWTSFNELRSCPFCTAALSHVRVTDSYDFGRFFRKGLLAACGNCRFWFWNWDALNDEVLEKTLAVSYLRGFDGNFPEVCAGELGQHLRRNPQLYHSLEPRKLEELVAAVFRSNYRDSEVVHVGKPLDGGFDVLFIDSESSQWLIQVKRRESPDAAEPVKTLRELVGAMVESSTLKGVVVTTADHFSVWAERYAQNVARVGFTIDLIDRGKLDRMVSAVLPVEPWMASIISVIEPGVAAAMNAEVTVQEHQGQSETRELNFIDGSIQPLVNRDSA